VGAPRTSMRRDTDMLRQLTAEWGGAGFWALLQGDEVICLNAVVADRAADPGFIPGEAKAISATRIPAALDRRADDFTPERDGERATLIVPVKSRRGHDFGWIGLTLPKGGATPPAADLRRRIETLSEVAA
jgi:hypothetical protein